MFRENILQLPKSKIAGIVTTIQKVLILLTLCDLKPSLTQIHAFQCIDTCLMDTIELASKRLKLLQDISSSSGIFPEPYWVSDISKGKRISVGGEATIYLGHRQGEVIIVREFHPVESSGLTKPEIERMKKVSPFIVCIICFLGDTCL